MATASASVAASSERGPIGVVIPAHNEEALIGRCIDALLAQAEPGEFDVVVVANGCSDRTAEVARRFGSAVRVLELPVGSKTRALAEGDAVLGERGFPRIYLDGDLELSTEAAREICRAVEKQGCFAAAPAFEFDTCKSHWVVKAFYEAWRTMPYLHDGRIAGAYALSRAGRSRFDSVPDVLADDGYVRLHFQSTERVTLETCNVTVSAPRTVGDLIRIKTRSRLGTIELRDRYPKLFDNETASEGASARRMFGNPRMALQFGIYLAVNAVVRWRAREQMRRGDFVWERDESSRLADI